MANPVSAIEGTAVRTSRNPRLLIAITASSVSKTYAVPAPPARQNRAALSVYLFATQALQIKFSGSAASITSCMCSAACAGRPIDAITLGSVSIKQNIHLVKNVMLPIELVPVRAVLVASATQAVGLAVVILLSALNGSLTLHVLWLPIVWALQILMLFGVVWILSSIAVGLPDISYFINLFLFLLMWVSPIGFTVDMVPANLAAVLYLNPVFYLLEVYRDVFCWGGSALHVAPTPVSRCSSLPSAARSSEPSGECCSTMSMPPVS